MERCDGARGLVPGGASSPQTITTNYQAHLPSLHASFGAGELLRVVPGVSDNVQVVARPDGGVDAFLSLAAMPDVPPDWIRRAQSASFRAELLECG